MMIVFVADRTGRTFLCIFLTWPPLRQVSPLTYWGGVCPLPGNSLALGSSRPACSGGEGRRLTPAACVHLPHWWILIPAAVVVTPLF